MGVSVDPEAFALTKRPSPGPMLPGPSAVQHHAALIHVCIAGLNCPEQDAMHGLLVAGGQEPPAADSKTTLLSAGCANVSIQPSSLPRCTSSSVVPQRL